MPVLHDTLVSITPWTKNGYSQNSSYGLHPKSLTGSVPYPLLLSISIFLKSLKLVHLQDIHRHLSYIFVIS